MAIERKEVINDGREAVDVTSLTPGTSYEVLRDVGPYYSLTERLGVVLRKISIPETGESIAVVNELVRNCGELVKITRARFSTAVVRSDIELVPRPGHNPLTPG